MINEQENIIVIVGHPATGKTHLSKELEINYPDYRIIHSDDYMKHGYEKSLYVMLEDIVTSPNKKMIIEGVQTPRLLRKGLELNNFNPDVIINTTADAHTKLERYKSRGQVYPYAMEKNIDTVMAAYRQRLWSTHGIKAPRLIEWQS
jgi:dephospho-CoA kinase